MVDTGDGVVHSPKQKLPLPMRQMKPAEQSANTGLKVVQRSKMTLSPAGKSLFSYMQSEYIPLGERGHTILGSV